MHQPHYAKAGRTSQALSACSRSAQIDPSCPTAQLNRLPTIFYGGTNVFGQTVLNYPSPPLPFADIQAFQMPALAWVSALSSVTDGEHGDSFRIGRMLEAQTETSDGQKRLDSKCSSAPSISCTQDFPESLHMGTTPASSKVGGQVVTATPKPTPSFDAFTPFSLKPITAEWFARDTSRAQKTQRMGHQEENTLRHISSFREFPSPLPLFPSSSTQVIPSPQMSRDPPHPPSRTFHPTPYT
jgi:hypothetical protein